MHSMLLPYSGKVWWVESLAILINRLWFTKLKPSKVLVTINNPLVDLFICQAFFCQTLQKSNSPNILPAKLFRYMVCAMHSTGCIVLNCKY